MTTTEDSIHICHDRTMPLALEETARRVAILENPANEADPNLDPNDPNLAPAERVALIAQKRWRAGKRLRIRFLDGSPTMQAKVAHYAAEWTRYANISFDFSGSAYAEIRISFYADRGSWSALGTDALVQQYFPLHQPTMNFGWLRDDTDETEYSRVTIHEFGHALGAIHEHQNPQGGIKWNEPAVYSYFAGPPNYWPKETTYRNVIAKYSSDILIGTQFDPASIMLYHFPAALTQNGVGTRSNTRLSQRDIEFIKIAYPR
ncbi:matrixin family metalloprotease [Sorangium sp. So ce726]|uniref:matrixin family metalloprotease n=1 Tax=Sorangium sp. So ce726 TaxID=3133319 RepID=UPI003F6243D4